MCGKVNRLAARKPSFWGRRANQERFSASGQATVRDPYQVWNSVGKKKIRFNRFGFDHVKPSMRVQSHTSVPVPKMLSAGKNFADGRGRGCFVTPAPKPRAVPVRAQSRRARAGRRRGARPIRARRTNRGERGARLEVIARDRRPRPVSAPSRRIGGTARRRQRTTGGHGSRGLQVLQGPVQHRGGEEAAGGPGDWAGSTRGNRQRRTRR